MKKVMNGKLYDTEKADQLFNRQYGYPSEFDWFTEDLYRTKKGAYFIYGKGNARSHYGQQTGQNEWSGGEGWRVLTEDEAKAYVEEYGSADDYIYCFGEPEEA